ncbi:type 4b pilus protein PilO2 [Salmonella enterica]|nr:type 4b pilus protein PilO2 [Salmonella enterica]EJF6007815.1 type 4b pilus protein PilO2 [Salmonella enterica]
MADENLNQGVLQPDPGNAARQWVAAMRWTVVERKKRRSPASASPSAPAVTRRRKIPGRLTLSVTVGQRTARGAKTRLAGVATVENPRRPCTFFSLSLAFCTQVRNGYGIYRLSDRQYLFLAAVDGLPAVMADSVDTPEGIQKKLALFLTMNEEPPEKWQVAAAPDAPLSPDTLIQQLSAADLRYCRVHHNRTRGRQLSLALALILAGLAGTGAFVYFTQPAPAPVPTPEEIAARSRLMFHDKTPAPELPHPWASLPGVHDMLSACRQLILHPGPVALDGWRLAGGECTPDGLSLLYERQPGGTAEGFLRRSREVFGVVPDFNLKEGASQAVIRRPLPTLTFHDESVPDPSSQLMRVLSWFQRKQVSPAIDEVVMPDPLPGDNADAGADGGPAPVQTWRDYHFTLSGPQSPDRLFHGLADTGIRLSSVRFELNGSAFTYTTEGHIYASK